MKPSCDPNCQRYIDDPDRTWYGGEWMTAEQIERKLVGKREKRASDPEWAERERERQREWERERRRDPEYRFRQARYKAQWGRNRRLEQLQKESIFNA